MIVTHTSPDFDAIGAVWLLRRFYPGLADAEVRFVNTGNPDPAILDAAVAVVDTGRVYDVSRLRFDHHQLPGAASNATCATMQVYIALCEECSQHTELYHLDDLIGLIKNGDTGGNEYGAQWSRRVGIHALLSHFKTTIQDDYAILGYGFMLLDTLAAHLKARHVAHQTLQAYTVYRSDDNRVIALKDAPQHATSAAFDQGARLVVFADYAKNAIGVMRGGEWQEPHVGMLVELLIADGAVNADVIGETDTWFLHNGGFFAGRGTAKAPRADPITVDLADVARAIDRSWKR
jgi:hypothetical protein